ncbi:hypothetical protein, partial [Microbulbifer sp. TYP-18]|uniref:hypothetical protein n=1 Tax=Microbulbifer sp. TYP-18 TaxID=3230024 RepID=UPI0034C5EC5D
MTRYATTAGGGYLAQGLAGGVTGNPADLIILDDPIRNRQEVESKAIMSSIRDNLSGAVRTRMHKDTAVIVMHTRWAEDDPAGYLLQAWQEGWEVLMLPALIETREQAAADPLGREIGEVLWSQRFPATYLRETRNAILPRDWNALYQQDPTPGEGALFSYSDFAEYDVLPRRLVYYGFHDGAVATPDEGEDPDMTELSVWGVDQAFNLYAVDWWTCQIDLDEWVGTLFDMAEDWRVQRWHAEKGVIAHASRGAIKREKLDRKSQLFFKWMPHIGDKEANVAGFRALCRRGKVYFPSRRSRLHGPWVRHVQDQLVKFPAGRFDDAVDTCGLAGRQVGDMIAARSSQRGKPKPKHGSMDWLTQFAEHAVEQERHCRRRN